MRKKDNKRVDGIQVTFAFSPEYSNYFICRKKQINLHKTRMHHRNIEK